jgi:hypothetical protein
MSGDPHDGQGPQLGTRPVYGDFFQQATVLLHRRHHPVLQPGPQQALVMTFAMRRIITVLSRYLDDLRIDTAAARGVPDPWVQALTESRRAMRRAMEALTCKRCSAAWPALSEGADPPAIPPDSLAARLHAAAAALMAGRDLLQTHFTADRAPRSDWAPAITSAPVSRALLAGLAACAAAAAPVESGVLQPAPGAEHGQEEAVWRHIRTASRQLRALNRSVERARQHTPALGDDVRLLHTIPVDAPPAHRLPAPGGPIEELCAGTINTVHRASHTLRGNTEQARWASDLTAESFRQIAASCVVTSINCEVILRTLTRRARYLRHGHLTPGLNDAAGADAYAR